MGFGGAFAGTEPAHPDRSFDRRLRLALGGIDAALILAGGGHTPGDSAYVERLPGVRDRGAAHGIASLEYLRGTLRPAVVIPRHGRVTGLDRGSGANAEQRPLSPAGTVCG